MNSNSPSSSENWRPLALLLVVVAALLVILFRLVPYNIRGANFVPAGAMILLAGARLRPKSLLVILVIPLLATDLYFCLVKSWAFPWSSYLGYTVYLVLGWWLLRRSESPVRIEAVALAGSIQFFLITNFTVWLQHVIQPELFTSQSIQYAPTLAGLMDCFAKGIPFYRGTFLSDLLFTGIFFTAHALLARACFPGEQVAPAAITEIDR